MSFTATHLHLITPKRTGAATAAIAAVIGVTVLVVFCDGVIFRAILKPSYVARFAGPHLGITMVVYLVSAAVEEIVFRLGVLSLLVLLINANLKSDISRKVAIALAVVVAQLLNLSRFPLPHGWEEIAYWSLRNLAPGLVWGWLYLRYSFVTALGAHVSSHLLRDPLLFLVLQS